VTQNKLWAISKIELDFVNFTKFKDKQDSLHLILQVFLVVLCNKNNNLFMYLKSYLNAD